MSTVRKYRKKPVEIEAIQFVGGAEHATPIIDWVLGHGGTATWDEAHDAYEGKDGKGYPASPEHILIHTLEGTMTAPVGWWIIRGVQGEFYACKPDIFAETYDPAK